MRSRARIVTASLAALATMVVAMPLAALFREMAWVPTAVLGVLLVMATGIAVRALVGHAGLVVAGQVLVGGGYLVATQLGGTTEDVVVPTGRTVPRLLALARDAQETITTYAAPAPETPGVSALLVLVVIVVALSVDLSATTADSATLAGVPLLSLFVVSAANSGGSLPWGWFVIGAALWLAMIAQESDRKMRAWTTAVPLIGHGDGEGIAQRSLRWQGARLAVLGLAAALVLPTLLPHLPTRYVLDGLGAGGAGSARSTDGIRLSTELDLKRSLESPSEEPVLRYTSDDPTPEPLRVAVVSDFAEGFGRMRSNAAPPREQFRLPPPVPGADEGISREEHTLTVAANGVAAPQVALPHHLTAVDTGGIAWALGSDGTGRVQRTPTSYTSRFLELDPQEEDFGSGSAGTGDPAYRDEYLSLDPASAEGIQQLASSLVPDGGDDLAAAQAFQEYLRGPDFEYDLTIPDPPGTPSDPILSFLQTKVGYCQQFAATLTLLARAHGIPARVVIGFLPGEAVATDERVIRASDAHAWPELYFPGVGWTRFEPTPGARAASVPSYSIAVDGPGATATDEATTTSGPTTSTTQAAPESPTDPAAIDGPAAEGTPWWTWLLGIVLVLAALGIMPASAWLTRRRERTGATDDAARVEVEWQDLLERLDDLGLRPPPGSTPRLVGEWVGRRSHLEEPEQEQLGHVVATLERARYGRPGQTLPDISTEVSSVVGAVRSQRLTGIRVRALLWPRAGVDAWLSLPQRLTDLVRRR